MLFTCAVDKTGAVWDCEVGERVKKLKGHTSFVNSICPARRGLSLLVTGSDDGNIKVGLPNNYMTTRMTAITSPRCGTSEKKERSKPLIIPTRLGVVVVLVCDYSIFLS